MLNFNDQELQVITKGLSALPWVEANPVINKILHFVSDKARRDALPDPFDEPVKITMVKKTVKKPSKKKPATSNTAKKEALAKILNSDEAASLSTAEIARRAGVSYVTAHKARAAIKAGK